MRSIAASGAFSKIVFPENRTKMRNRSFLFRKGAFSKGLIPGKAGKMRGVERILSVHGSILILKIARMGAERRKKAPNELNEAVSDPVLTLRRPKNEREIAQKIEKPVFC